MSSAPKVVHSHLKQGKAPLQLETINDSPSSDEIDAPTAGQRKRAARAQRKKERAARKRLEKDSADTRSIVSSNSDTSYLSRSLHCAMEIRMSTPTTPVVLAPLHHLQGKNTNLGKGAVAVTQRGASACMASPSPTQQGERAHVHDATLTRNDLLQFQHQLIETLSSQFQQQQQQLSSFEARLSALEMRTHDARAPPSVPLPAGISTTGSTQQTIGTPTPPPPARDRPWPEPRSSSVPPASSAAGETGPHKSLARPRATSAVVRGESTSPAVDSYKIVLQPFPKPYTLEEFKQLASTCLDLPSSARCSGARVLQRAHACTTGISMASRRAAINLSRPDCACGIA
eukprot:5823939-Amphidinium_carterae.1